MTWNSTDRFGPHRLADDPRMLIDPALTLGPELFEEINGRTKEERSLRRASDGHFAKRLGGSSAPFGNEIECSR